MKEKICSNGARRVIHGTIVVSIAFMFLMLSITPITAAKKGPGEIPEEISWAWGNIQFPSYGGQATFDVVDPSYTSDTKSVVCYSVSVIFPGYGWIQTGYLTGFYVTPRGNLMQATVPTVYVEIFDYSGASQMVYTFLTPDVGSTHTWSIYWHWFSENWEVYYDDYHLTSIYWMPSIYCSEIVVQGECQDNDDRSNGIVHFDDVSYYMYDELMGRLNNPHWVIDGVYDWGYDYPWHMYLTTYGFNCWINY